VASKLLATTLLQQGQAEKAKAIVDAMRGGADDPALSELRGKILLRQGEYAGARKQIESALAAGADNSGTYLELAASEQGLGNVDAMFKALAKAAALDKTAAGADLILINALIKAQRYDDALKAVDALAGKQAKPALMHNLRGVIYSAKRDFGQARASFRKSLEADPNQIEAASNLAYMDVQAKDYAAARSHFEQVLKNSPNDSRVWVALAKIAMVQKDDAGTRDSLDKAKRADGKNVEARQLLVRYWLSRSNPDLALQEAREALATTGDANFQEQIGMALAMKGDNQGALDAFVRWTNDLPDSPEALTRLGQVQAMMGKGGEALRSLDQALALRPDYFDALAAKVSILADTGHSDESLKLARNLQSRYPNQMVGYLGEANALASGKKFAEAAKLFVKAAQMSNQSRLIAKAAQAYVQAGNPAEAVHALEQWLQSHPDDLAIRREMALSLEQARRPKEAVEQYRQLLKANPQDVVACNNLAMLLNDLKDPGAVATAEQAYKLRPDNVMIQDTLGWVLLNNGQGARGIGLIKQAYDAKPDSPDFQWHYAKALALTGESVLARHELENLLARFKNFSRADEARQLLASLKH
jgi:putative PEP-CTERM system TPR-repeat lipoprotein